LAALKMGENLPAGVPGFKQAPCLGCGRPVYESEEFLSVVGTRSGSFLLVQVSSDRMWQTSAGPKPGETLEVLGVIHWTCRMSARKRLEAGEVEFPETLPIASLEEI
jgi:hypothetical protein